MRVKHVGALLACIAAAPYAAADTFNLSLSAEDGARWYEYYSGVYAELGSNWGAITNESSADLGEQADGFYLIDTGAKIGSGSIVFPSLGNFLNVGSLTYNGGTGTITGLTADFSRYIADDDSLLNAGYSTSFSNLSGTVSLVGGKVAAIDLTSDIRFTYVNSGTSYNFDGIFTITGNQFALHVDDTELGAFRYRWDADGSVQNLAAVPEPSSYAMFFAGLALVGAMVRRQRSQA